MEGTRSSSRSAIQRRVSQFHQFWSWTRLLTSYAPVARSGAASVVVQGKLFVFGGYGGGTGRLDDFWSFDFETGLWEEVPVLSQEKPGCRENNGVVISDSNRFIYLFGGYNGQAWLNDLWQYDIETKRWTCIQESSGPVRADESNAAVGDAGNNLSNKGPTRRFGYVSVVHKGKLVLFGGFDGSRWLNDMYVLEFATNSWMEVQAQGPVPTARSCPAWAKDDSYVYIQGGYDGMERKSDFFALDLETYTWTELPCLGTPPSPRYFHSCCLYGDRLYLYGGYSGSERLADMYAYDFATNHWMLIDCTAGDAPSGRSSLVAQVYNNSLYIFGGYNGSSVLNDFFRFKLQPIGVPPTGMVRDMLKMLHSAELADVSFLVEGKEVVAHKAILAARSEYFRVMLLGGMKESDDRSIVIPSISHEVFCKVLEYLYTDSVGETSLEIGIHLLIASEQFMLDRLKALCEDLIRSDITTDSVISILVASHRHNATSLKELALEFIQSHLDDPVVMRGLSDLKVEPDLLLELIRRKQITSNNPQAAHYDAVGGPFGANAENWNAPR